MATVREMLSSRKAEVKRLISELKAEYQEILIAENALGAPPIPYDLPLIKRRGKRSRTTLKEMIKAVLQEKPEGADSFEIMELIKTKFEKDVPRESLSPQLSRLKNDDKVLELIGNNWVLIKKEPPEGGSLSIDDLI